MKKLIYITVILLFCKTFAYSQINLVPNFSFEQYDTCPNAQDQAQYSTGWTKVSDVISTPDYYNACAPSTAFGVPQSGIFYQADHRNCGAFMGLITWDNNGYREHLGIHLNQPLVVGQKYYLSFNTVRSGCFDGTDYYDNPSNNIGMRLSTVTYDSSNPVPINNFSHLRSIAIINDTVNWLRVSGSILADSAYNFLMLGNFYDNANTDTTFLNCVNCINNFSYYLLDDICVSTDSLLSNGGIDALSCATSITENDYSNQINVFPNPISEVVAITSKYNSIDEITLTDMYGKILFSEKKIKASTVTLNLASYSSGIYFIKINNKRTQSVTKKIIKP